MNCNGYQKNKTCYGNHFNFQNEVLFWTDLKSQTKTQNTWITGQTKNIEILKFTDILKSQITVTHINHICPFWALQRTFARISSDV